jgi:prevent-host-death family protein
MAILEVTMPKRYSIAEARHNLAALVHELERKTRIELTRRGEPVAVLLSVREYQRLTAKKGSFWQAYESFRRAVDLPRLKIDPNVFEGVRDQSAGREIRL